MTEKEVAGVPPKDTAVAPTNLVPVIVTVWPVPAAVGLKLLTVGAGRKVNPERLPDQVPAVTVTLPVDPLPTTARMLVELTTVNEVAGVPPNLTEVVPVKLAPLIVMVCPVPAETGLKEDTEGA